MSTPEVNTEKVRLLYNEENIPLNVEYGVIKRLKFYTDNEEENFMIHIQLPGTDEWHRMHIKFGSVIFNRLELGKDDIFFFKKVINTYDRPEFILREVTPLN